ncbi:SDR family NAD(P)-dependent oxidoreductase [Bacteroides intestinalis]|uniref:SDR family NAD(P)-dependent oxidoreductase n=1 Tax=Bacteroides intestinalis TaxID=329854 RepID=A0A415N793_9BACE|nr:SDR family oxidoreductase [Bacteroides intestinalis]RHL91593.1 SDR family NAD(P)-dependent oxidoreductase [Bacteroides intestinalis]
MLCYNPYSLEGKRILVTGASSGIGKSIAVECSKMGAQLIICGRNQERLEEVLSALEGTGHQCVIGDLLQNEDIDSLLSQISQLDGVVFSAGKGLTLPFQFSTREKFDDIFNINFFSPVELLRLLVKKKKLHSNSSVVFIVSIGGTGRFFVGNSIYGASKAALQAMVRFCAQELASKKVRVNGINPGMVNTPLIRKGTLTDEQLEEDRAKYPLKRYGEPEDIAYAAIYLLSNASSWVTGQSIIIDGGITSK